ncbi:MAG: hypothetical protein IPP40_06560 [bacterium]|nr:hypothetical protein [bacterium]
MSRYIKHMIVTGLFTTMSIPAFAQPAVHWTNSYTGFGMALPYAVEQTNDGGFVTVGTIGVNAPYSIKVDSAGTFVWSNTTFAAGPAAGHSALDVAENPDGSLVIIGTNFGQPWDARYWYSAKLNASGGLVWHNLISNGILYGNPYSLSRCNDGSFIIGGDDFFGSLSSMRMSSVGANLYERTYDCGLIEMLSLSDGTFIGAGTSMLGANAPDFYLVHTDGLGSMDWQRTLDLNQGQNCYAMDITNDNGLVLAGNDSLGLMDNDLDLFIVMTNGQGDTLWTRHFDTDWSENVQEIETTSDGGFVMLCQRSAGPLLMKINSVGDSIWSVPLSHSARALTITQDGGYMIAGYDASHLYLTKYGPDAALPAPQGLTISIADGLPVLKWNSVVGATSYEVYAAAESNGAYSLDVSGMFSDTTWTTPFLNSHQYYYVVARR